MDRMLMFGPGHHFEFDIGALGDGEDPVVNSKHVVTKETVQ